MGRKGGGVILGSSFPKDTRKEVVFVKRRWAFLIFSCLFFFKMGLLHGKRGIKVLIGDIPFTVYEWEGRRERHSHLPKGQQNQWRACS